MVYSRASASVFLALAATFASASGDSWEWLTDNLIKKIFISGQRQIGLHFQHVSGDKQAFQDLNYSGLGGHRFTDTGNLSIDGRSVLGVLNFQMQVSDNRYSNPENQRMSLNYDKGPYSMGLGDINGTLLNTNPFASFSRNLKGVQAGFKNGRFAMKGVQSRAKGSATTLSIQGNNSVGPYYLQNSRIAQDTVQVQVDGQDVQLGTDYTVDYEIGAITFNTRIIPPTSTIVATYEALSINGAGGTVQGLGMSYDAGRFGKLGISSLGQNPSGTQGLSQRTDLFQGFGDPSIPYTLQFEPMQSKPIIVKLQGIVQTLGVHYRFDTHNPAVFYFLFPVPATSNIDVTYTPVPVEAVDGKRHVFGFDYSLPIGGKKGMGALTYSQALGSLAGATPMSGVARRMGVTYNLGGLQLRGSYEDVPQTFVGIESTGFLRNEKATNFSAQSSKGPFGYGLTYGNSVISSRTADMSGNVLFSNARTGTTDGFFSYAPSSNMSWRLENVTNSSDTTAGVTRMNTSSLTNSWKIGRLGTNFGYDITTGRGPLSNGNANVMSTIGLNTLHFGTTYNAGAAWSLGANVGVSHVQTSLQNGVGNDVSLNAEFKPSQKLDVQFITSQSRSGALAALAGFQNGSGIGYNGNGFTSGVSTVGLLNSGTGDNYRSNLLAVTYQLSPKINLATRFNDGSSSGSISSNSSSKSMSFDMDWDLGRGHTTGLSLTNSHTTFLSSTAISNSTTVDWFLSGNPKGSRWSYRFDTNMLLSGGTTQFGQNSISFDGSLSRKINMKQLLGMSTHIGRTTGYLPQLENSYEIFHEYQLYQNIALRTGYTWRKVLNSDPALVAGQYQASGLDLDLTFDFVP